MDVLSHPNAALKQMADPSIRPPRRTCGAVPDDGPAMYDAPGIGLAAPQIGVLKRVIVYDLEDERPGVIALCNPEIVERSDERRDSTTRAACRFPASRPDRAGDARSPARR